MSTDPTDQLNNSLERAEIGISLLSGNLINKYLLYRKYLAPDSLWVKNKNEYWALEQAVLYWTWSKHHQHMNAPAFNINRVHYLFMNEIGTLYDSKKTESMRLKIKQSDLYLIQAIMGNIYRKGFAAALLGKDHVKTLEDKKIKLDDKSEIEQINAIEKWLEANFFEVTNLFINDTGLIMGELIHEFNSRSTNRILFPIIYFIEPVMLYSLVFALLVGLTSILIDPNDLPKNSFLIAYSFGGLLFGIIPMVKRIWRYFKQS